MNIDKLKNKFSTGAFVADVKHYFSKINEIIDWINNIGSTAVPDYKIYRALLTQSFPDPPSAIVLENTLGSDVNWSYYGTGIYIGAIDYILPEGKTFVSITSTNITEYLASINVQNLETDQIRIKTVNSRGGIDDVLNTTSVEIIIYN